MKFPTASGSCFWVLNGELHSPPSTPLGAMCLGQHQAAGHFGCAPVPTRLFESRAQKRLPSAGGRWCNLLSPPRSQKRAPSAGGRAGAPLAQAGWQAWQRKRQPAHGGAGPRMLGQGAGPSKPVTSCAREVGRIDDGVVAGVGHNIVKQEKERKKERKIKDRQSGAGGAHTARPHAHTGGHPHTRQHK
jgi:hypothetical protein